MRKLILLLVSCLTILDANGQLFRDFQLTEDSVTCRINSDQSFIITSGDVLHVVYYQDNDTSQLLYYSIIDTTSGKLLFQHPVDTFSHNEQVKYFIHDYSLFEGRNDSLYLFYLREKTERDDNDGTMSSQYQVIFRKIKDDYVSPAVILYETSFPVLNIEFSVDQEGDFYGGILSQTEDWPESPVKITYVDRDTAFIVDSNLVATEIKNFEMEVDTCKNLHFFLSNYDVSKDKYYLNHWEVNNEMITKSLMDSISTNLIVPWFRTVKLVKNKRGELLLLTLSDIIIIYTLQKNNFVKFREVPFVDNDAGTILYSATMNDSLIHITTWNYQKSSRYIVVSPYNPDQYPVNASFKHVPVELKIDSEGFVYGIYCNDQLSMLKSAIRLNPLPSLTPLKPQLECEDTSLCAGEDKKLVYKGISIKWYENEELIHLGDTLDLSGLEVGTHQITLSENILDVESPKDTVIVEVNPLPTDFLYYASVRYDYSSILIIVDDIYKTYFWNGYYDDNTFYYDASINSYGQYTIELTVTDWNNCYATESVEVWFYKTASAPEQSGLAYPLYPNPTTRSVTVTVDHSVDKIFLVNETGQVLKVFHPDSDKIMIDLNEFINGIYYLNLITKSGKIIQKKIIKQ